MADIIKILEEHTALLHERGYDEIGLGSIDEPGWFVKQMEDTFSRQLSRNDSEKDIHSFELKAVGFFNNERDLVAFIFRYQFEPICKKMDLLSMKAELNNSSKEINFPKGLYELPNVEKVIAMLKNQNQDINDSVNALNPAEDERLMHLYKKNLADHQTLLAVKGYTDKAYFPYTNDFLLKKLETRFIKRFCDNDQPREFVIRTKGFFGSEKQEVDFSLFYEVRETHNMLNLITVMANYEKKRAICYLKESNDLPAAAKIWNQLNELEYDANVNIIYPKEQIKLILREQEDLLGRLGYYRTFISNNFNFIERELHDIIQKHIQETTHQTITITRDIHLDFKNSLNCVFYYSFDPVKISLQLESLTANVGTAEKKYFPLDLHANITFQNMFLELDQGQRHHQARKVINQMFSDKSKINYKKKP